MKYLTHSDMEAQGTWRKGEWVMCSIYFSWHESVVLWMTLVCCRYDRNFAGYDLICMRSIDSSFQMSKYMFAAHLFITCYAAVACQSLSKCPHTMCPKVSKPRNRAWIERKECRDNDDNIRSRMFYRIWRSLNYGRQKRVYPPPLPSSLVMRHVAALYTTSNQQYRHRRRDRIS